MWVILFDLDFTLANTEDCQPYLTTQVGRDKIVSLLKSQDVKVSSYGKELVTAFNQLYDHSAVRAVVISDSPKKYCVEVLKQCGYKIDDDLVFGAQGKPLVKFEAVKSEISESLEVNAGALNFIVVGDSPKDIYFAHSIQAISVFAQWGTRHRLYVSEKCRPTFVVNDIDELKDVVKNVREGGVGYKRYDFKSLYLTYDYKDVERNELKSLDIGFGREYVPKSENYRSDKDKYASQDLHWVVKKAKNFSETYHKAQKRMSIYGGNGIFETDPLMRKSGFFKLEFLRWCEEKKISGKVALVPVPSSVPYECNLSCPITMMCDWWAFWIKSESGNKEFYVRDVFERFWPRPPSHLSDQRRNMEEQFHTLGVYLEDSKEVWDVDYVIIVDDVVTSGSHINAVASFIRTAGLVGTDVKVLGYALFKTVHPENEF